MTINAFDRDRLKQWFFLFRRPLPWRENPSPYAVWISEVMLQQTQVSVVIPYFEKWMGLFPTIQALAKAPLEQVIKTWEGLGYYSRARNLHEGARYLLETHGGKLPEEARALQKVKGIGPYTVGAIRSFAFKQKAAAVDGNVLRVMARLFSIKEPISEPHTRRQIDGLTKSFLRDKEPWIVMEALIELGALVCKKKPSCANCPLKTSCLAYKQNQVEELPRKGKKIPTTFLHRLVAIVQSQNRLLLQKREKGKIMADLWEFPYIDISPPIEKGKSSHLEEVEKNFPLPLIYEQSLPEVSHSFTQYKAFLYPHLWQTKKALPIPKFRWVSWKELMHMPFSSGHRQILRHLMKT